MDPPPMPPRASASSCRVMSQVSMASGIGRAVLYRSFSKSGNPTLQVLLDSLRAVGLTLVVAEAKDR